MAVCEQPIKDDVERPVPPAWRPVLGQIVEAIRTGDARLASDVPGVGAVDVETAVQISEYVEDYGETLVALPEETWETSIALWLGSCWEVLVDLWTEPGVRSDLVLHVQAFEQDSAHRSYDWTRPCVGGPVKQFVLASLNGGAYTVRCAG